jgi:hypothetical protein
MIRFFDYNYSTPYDHAIGQVLKNTVMEINLSSPGVIFKLVLQNLKFLKREVGRWSYFSNTHLHQTGIK